MGALNGAGKSGGKEATAMDQGDATQVKVITVSQGGFRVIPAGSKTPVVVMCGGVSEDVEQSPGPDSRTTSPEKKPAPEPEPDPESIFNPSVPHPGTASVLTIEALEQMDPASDLGEDVSTLVVEAKPSQYGRLSVLNDLVLNEALAQRGIDIEVRAPRDD
jgi:hypothetical protein